MEKEIRIFESDVQVEQREGKDGRGIKGRASVFNKLSRNLGWFREKIDAKAFDDCDMSDAIACRNHDPDKVMARTAAKTLNLDTDTKGLNYSFDAPNTTVGNDTLEDIRIGNIMYSSFAFTVGEDKWEEDEEYGEIRTILKINKLYDVSPVTNPAYFGTEVQANSMAKRSYDEWKKEKEEEKPKPEDSDNDDMGMSWREAKMKILALQ
jgi:HK97 family phage prohead protease